MPVEQFELNFEAGLTDQFPEWADVLKAAVYSCGKPFKVVAADLDLSSSMLSRMLNPHDTSVNFPAQRLADLIDATGDHRPIYWLVERFCRSEEDKQQQAIAQLSEMLPRIEALLKKAG